MARLLLKFCNIPYTLKMYSVGYVQKCPVNGRIELYSTITEGIQNVRGQSESVFRFWHKIKCDKDLFYLYSAD